MSMNIYLGHKNFIFQGPPKHYFAFDLIYNDILKKKISPVLITRADPLEKRKAFLKESIAFFVLYNREFFPAGFFNFHKFLYSE